MFLSRNHEMNIGQIINKIDTHVGNSPIPCLYVCFIGFYLELTSFVNIIVKLSDLTPFQ